MCKKLESKSKQTFVVFVAPWFFFTLYHFAVQSTIPLSNIVFGFVAFRVKKHKPLVLSETSGNLESTLGVMWIYRVLTEQFARCSHVNYFEPCYWVSPTTLLGKQMYPKISYSFLDLKARKQNAHFNSGSMYKRT